MDIYPQTRICFIYKWTQLSTSKWYIGSHTSKTANPNDGYICSSKIVKPLILANRDDWIRVILETGSADDMVTLEWELLTCLGAAKSPYSYNRHNGGVKFCCFGHSDETKLKISKSSKNISEETRSKLSLASKNISNETRVKISKAGKGRIVSNETRTKLSELGRNMSQETKDKMSEKAKKKDKITCPFCGKTGDSSNMKGWHFDNCKFKPK